jgi:hypothetical protein
MPGASGLFSFAHQVTPDSFHTNSPLSGRLLRGAVFLLNRLAGRDRVQRFV